MASGNPARVLGLPIGQLRLGCAADLIQFELPEGDGPIRILATVNHGECVFGQVVEKRAE